MVLYEKQNSWLQANHAEMYWAGSLQFLIVRVFNSFRILVGGEGVHRTRARGEDRKMFFSAWSRMDGKVLSNLYSFLESCEYICIIGACLEWNALGLCMFSVCICVCARQLCIFFFSPLPHSPSSFPTLWQAVQMFVSSTEFAEEQAKSF